MQAYRLGDSYARVQEEFSMTFCVFVEEDGRQLKACVVPIRDYAVRLRDTMFAFHEDKLEKIDSTFDSTDYVTLLGAATAKYGKPTRSFVVTIRNAFGAAIPSRNTVWIRSGISFMIAERRGILADGMLLITRDIPKNDKSVERARKM